MKSGSWGSGAYIAIYPVGTWDPFPGAKQKGHEADHLPPSSVKVKNSGTVLPLPHMFSWRGA
jgi:hypothetical protein